MLKYHPDVNKSSYAAEKTKLINEAYEVLKDSQKRKEYDALYKYQHTSHARTASSGYYYEAEEERKRRQQAEWEANEARRQAEKERQNAAYERQKRQQAEKAAKRADVTRDIYLKLLHLFKRVWEFFRQNKPLAYVLAGVLILLMLIRPITRTLNFDLQAQILKWAGFEITAAPTEMVPIMKFSTPEPTSILAAQALTITPQQSNPTILATSTSMTTFQGAQITQTDGTILFSDDFSDVEKTKEQWDNDPLVWEIVYERLRFTQNSQAFSVDKSWSNYTLKLNMMCISAIDKIVFFRVLSEEQAYYIFLRSGPINDLVLGKGFSEMPDEILKRVAILNFTDTWYAINISVYDNVINIYIDDVLMMNYIDENQPYLTGGIGVMSMLPADPDAAAYYDNVLVTTLGQ